MKKATKIVLSVIGAISALGIATTITIKNAESSLTTHNKNSQNGSLETSYQKQQDEKYELEKLSIDTSSYQRKEQTQSNLNMIDNNMEQFKTSYRNVLKPYSIFTNDNNLLIYKTLYVYADSSVSLTGKSIISSCVNYLDSIINYINPDYHVKTTTSLGNNVSYVSVSEAETSSNTSRGVELARTEMYDKDNKPLSIKMFKSNIEKTAQQNIGTYNVSDLTQDKAYFLTYAGTFTHEFCHFMGFDHNSQNEQYLMHPSSSRFGGFYPSELLALFNYENGSKYAQTDSTNFFLIERNRFLSLLSYSYSFLNDYFIDSSSNSDWNNNQIIEMETKDTKLILNSKYLNYYQYCENGTTTSGPFIVVNKDNKKSIILLTNDLRNEFKTHIENSVNTFDVATGIDYESAKNLIANSNYNNYKITSQTADKKLAYQGYENILDMWQNRTTTKYADSFVYKYNIQTTTHWKIDGTNYCDGTNNYLEKEYSVNNDLSQKVAPNIEDVENESSVR